MATIYSVHPAIGIARLGDSGHGADDIWNGAQDSYYIGPEAPGPNFLPQPYEEGSQDGHGCYRGRDRKIRRQGARFRIYRKEINQNGDVTDATEITQADADSITWRVKLANRKATGKRFPTYHTAALKKLQEYFENNFPERADDFKDIYLRNYKILGDDREQRLVIEEEGSIDAGSADHEELRGDFEGAIVKLADIKADPDGRLIVLGGLGISKSPAGEAPQEPKILQEVAFDPTHPFEHRLAAWQHRLYNWDGWCDDTSDGEVSVELVIGGEAVEVEPAWVIVAPPDYAAAARSPVTLYDLSYSVIRKTKLAHGNPVPGTQVDVAGNCRVTVSFKRHIYPILRNTVDLKYASDRGRLGHGGGTAGDFLSTENLAKLSSDADDTRAAKVMFMERLTRPGDWGGSIQMPLLYGGVDPESPTTKPRDGALRGHLDSFGKPLTMTPYQFELLEAWATHNFVADWTDEAAAFPSWDRIDDERKPGALDRAALEQCNGGSFHPGIETSYFLGDADTFRTDAHSWFRIKADTKPGTLTMNLAIPWQHDFAACSELWWPGQRPVSVPLKEADGSIKYVDWKANEFPGAGLEDYPEIFKTAGFVRRHPEDGDKVYLDDCEPEVLLSQLETGSPEALEVRELLAAMRGLDDPA